MGYHNLDTAHTGQEAVEKLDKQFKNTPYDILLLDLKMPNGDGFSVAEHIRDNRYDYPKVAVITASVLENDKERCKELGINYFLLKPFNMTQLRVIIHKLLNGTM